MIDIVNEKKCSGCHACFQICPQNCIKMEYSGEGFLYPVVDEDRCIHCNLCENVCPILHKKEQSGNSTEAYAAINKSEDIRKASSSGGVFSYLAENIINRGGVVFGAAFSKDYHTVEHICVDTVDDLYKLRGSKYLQSVIGNSYKEAEVLLKEGRNVLFTGTPCQIEGLYAYLKKDYTCLYTADIICHGVPSPKVWDFYLKRKEKEIGAPVKQVTFRNKCSGWKYYSVKMFFSNNETYTARFREDLYMEGFLKNLYLRPSCYDCAFKGINRISDITLGDFWGIDRIIPQMDDDKGISLVCIHTHKGKSLIEWQNDMLHIKEVNIDDAILYNGAAIKSSPIHPKRKKFFEKLNEANLSDLIIRCTNTSKVKIFCGRLARYAKRLLKSSTQN
jgi:coenzyme F420-reducing hydrogenase beta subunit